MSNHPAYAENAVLGGLMLANERFHDVASLLSVDHFTTQFRRQVFAGIRDRIRDGEPADTVTMIEALGWEGEQEKSSELIRLASNTPSAANILAYARIVRENWRNREAITIASRLMAGARDGLETSVDEAVGALMELNSSVAECDHTLKQAMGQAFAQIQAAYENEGTLPGITTGIKNLDEILGGWHKGDLVIVGARPAMGKTALMLNFAEAAAQSKRSVGIISAEQPAAQIGLRSISLGSQVAAADLRRGKVDDLAWSKINVAIRNTAEFNVRIYDRSAITLDELIGVARKWKHTYGLDILFLDYAQRITVPGAERITEVATIARGLKNLARDMNIPLIALAQVKAAVDTRNDRRPQQGDLANSDELSREADEILMLYREEAIYRDVNEQNKPVRKGIAELHIEKNRHGPTGYTECAFVGETMRFANLEYGR